MFLCEYPELLVVHSEALSLDLIPSISRRLEFLKLLPQMRRFPGPIAAGFVSEIEFLDCEIGRLSEVSGFSAFSSFSQLFLGSICDGFGEGLA